MVSIQRGMQLALCWDRTEISYSQVDWKQPFKKLQQQEEIKQK